MRLLLGVIAYNLGNLLRRLVLPRAIQSWSLTSLQQRPFKTGGRLIRHARYFILQLADSYLTRTLFGQILGRIERLAAPDVSDTTATEQRDAKRDRPGRGCHRGGGARVARLGARGASRAGIPRNPLSSIPHRAERQAGERATRFAMWRSKQWVDIGNPGS